jgi:hypothetical protein
MRRSKQDFRNEPVDRVITLTTVRPISSEQQSLVGDINFGRAINSITFLALHSLLDRSTEAAEMRD